MPTWTQKKPTWTFGEFPQTSVQTPTRHALDNAPAPPVSERSFRRHTRERMLRTRPPPLSRPSAPRTRGLRGPARLVVNGAAKKKKPPPLERDAAPPALEVHDNPQPVAAEDSDIHGGGAGESNVVAVPAAPFPAPTPTSRSSRWWAATRMALARANSRKKMSRETLLRRPRRPPRERPLRGPPRRLRIRPRRHEARRVRSHHERPPRFHPRRRLAPRRRRDKKSEKKVQAKWAKVPGDERVRIVLAVADAIAKNATLLGNLLTLEVGKTPSESLGELAEIAEVAAAIGERADECGGRLPLIPFAGTSPATKRENRWGGTARNAPYPSASSGRPPRSTSRTRRSRGARFRRWLRATASS